jgi:hypothetical protein
MTNVHSDVNTYASMVAQLAQGTKKCTSNDCITAPVRRDIPDELKIDVAKRHDGLLGSPAKG